MARFESGWIKFYRRAWEEDIGSNIYCLCTWVALLSMAHWKESKIVWEGKQRTLPPGSVVFGIKELADRWECSRSVVKKWLHYLNDTGRIVLETSPRGCIATICNWAVYQSEETPPCSPQDHSVTSTSHQRDTNAPLIEEVKKKRKKEGKVREALSPLAEIWNRYRGNLPEVMGCTGKRKTSADARWEEKPSTEHWAEIIDRIQRSEFCNGKNERGWKADFDFLIRPDTQHKVTEGKYDNRTQSHGGYVDPEILKIRKMAEEEDRANGTA